jgi:hypothetical protein
MINGCEVTLMMATLLMAKMMRGDHMQQLCSNMEKLETITCVKLRMKIAISIGSSSHLKNII